MKIFVKIFLPLTFVLIFPISALANCQWFPPDDSSIYNIDTCGGDPNWQPRQDNFCVPQLRKTGFTQCCCGADGEATGCCFCSEQPGGVLHFYGVFTTQSQCAVRVGSSATGTIPCEFRQGKVGLWVAGFATPQQRENACVADQNHCYWYTNENCSDIGLVPAQDPTWCRASEKPSAATAKCCCGVNVDQTPKSEEKPPQVETPQQAPDYSGMTNPLNTVDPSIVIGRIIRAILSIIGSIFLIMVIYGGFTWMTAAGNESKVEQGRKILIWATLGMVVIFSAWMLTGLVLEALGV